MFLVGSIPGVLASRGFPFVDTDDLSKGDIPADERRPLLRNVDQDGLAAYSEPVA
jgi:hypothetical protein